MFATVPSPDPSPGLHGKATAEHVQLIPADVRNADTGEIIPGMQWRCVIKFMKSGKINKRCVLIGTIPLTPTPTNEAVQ